MAAATKTVVVILIIVDAETRDAQEPFIFWQMISHSAVRTEKLIKTTGNCSCRDIGHFRAVTFGSLTAPLRGGDCRLRPSTPV